MAIGNNSLLLYCKNCCSEQFDRITGPSFNQNMHKLKIIDMWQVEPSVDCIEHIYIAWKIT